MQFTTPKDITCDASKTMWPGVPGLDARVTGRIAQWTNKTETKLKSFWKEPDGSESHESPVISERLALSF